MNSTKPCPRRCAVAVAAALALIGGAGAQAAEPGQPEIDRHEQEIRELRQDVGREFGFVSRMVSRALGPVMLWSARREERRLRAGHTYEPRTIIERRNWDWAARLKDSASAARVCGTGALAGQPQA